MALGDFLSRFDPTTQQGRNQLSTGLGLGGYLYRTAERSKMENEQKISDLQKELEGSLESTKEYKTPEEALRIQQLAEESAANLRGVKEIGQKAVGIAEFQAGLSQVPGEMQAREDIKGSTAQAIQSIIESGGGNAAALGAIADVNRNQMESLRQLSAQNQQYRAQATRDLQSSLMGQASLEAGIESQALGAETMGLQTLIGEKGKEYESYLDKLRTQQQYDITEIGNAYASEEARKNRNAQLWGSIIGGLSGLGSSVATGGAA